MNVDCCRYSIRWYSTVCNWICHLGNYPNSQEQVRILMGGLIPPFPSQFVPHCLWIFHRASLAMTKCLLAQKIVLRFASLVCCRVQPKSLGRRKNVVHRRYFIDWHRIVRSWLFSVAVEGTVQVLSRSEQTKNSSPRWSFFVYEIHPAVSGTRNGISCLLSSFA